jgi:hypothetical protein
VLVARYDNPGSGWIWPILGNPGVFGIEYKEAFLYGYFGSESAWAVLSETTLLLPASLRTEDGREDIASVLSVFLFDTT